jgi:hypothetical protein
MFKRLITILFAFMVSTVAASAQTGQISGKLTFPGDGIPRDLVLCVISKVSPAETTYCSNTKTSTLTAARITFKVDRRKAAYQVALPAGPYLIFAKTSEMSGHRAFYNDFVKCGMEYTCKSTKPVTVVVRTGQTTKGITVGDFWNVD